MQSPLNPNEVSLIDEWELSGLVFTPVEVGIVATYVVQGATEA